MKNKPNSNPIYIRPQDSWGLKKQSQFVERRNDVISVIAMAYSDLMGKDSEKQSQFKAKTNPICLAMIGFMPARGVVC